MAGKALPNQGWKLSASPLFLLALQESGKLIKCYRSYHGDEAKLHYYTECTV